MIFIAIIALSRLLALVDSVRVGVLIPDFRRDPKVLEFPHQISLAWTKKRDEEKYYCSGSVIASEWILTTATCVIAIPDDDKIYIYCQGPNKHEDYICNFIKDSYIHPNDEGELSGYDVALLKLVSGEIFAKDERVKSIRLPVPSVQYENDKAILTSINATEIKTIEVLVIENQVCNDSIVARTNRPSVLYPTNICTQTLGTSPVCTARSGYGVCELVGISSWTLLPCEQNGDPLVYVRISSFVDWIQETISENSEPEE